MDRTEIETAINELMHPTVFTGVKPVLLVAEELATSSQVGDIIDAVWVHVEEGGTLSYITRFAVEGKITRRSYYSEEELGPFQDRLALPENHNLEKMVLHRALKQEIKTLKAKRGALADEVHYGLDGLEEALAEGKELFAFKKRRGEWHDPFSDFDIEHPYPIVEKPEESAIGEYYGYMAGSRADIAGLQLKSESYKKKIEALENEAREVIQSIEWLSFDDPRIKATVEKLPRYPFDDYFKYVKKGEERKLQPPEKLLEALKLIIEKHMPEFITPLGIEYIPIDNLLYLFHAIIPRAEALRALEHCDIIHEPAGLLLGFEGKRKLPPKFLVSLAHVACAYQKFPAFTGACEEYLAEADRG